VPSPPELTVLGQAVRAYREARGLSKRALSLAAGLSESYVTKLEAGTLEPSLRAFAAVVDVLGLSTAEVVLLVRLEAHPRVDRLEHPGVQDVLVDDAAVPAEPEPGGATGQRPADVLAL
jgi:transcriptional regulator with XRE-family HTH domain